MFLADFYRSIIGAALGLLVGVAGVIITVHHNSHKVDRVNKNFQPDHPTLAFLKGCLVETDCTCEIEYNSRCIRR